MVEGLIFISRVLDEGWAKYIFVEHNLTYVLIIPELWQLLLHFSTPYNLEIWPAGANSATPVAMNTSKDYEEVQYERMALRLFTESCSNWHLKSECT